MVGLDFEAAVLGPEVDGNADASDAALVDLRVVLAHMPLCACLWIVLTISAASVPAMANSMSAYLFQKP